MHTRIVVLTNHSLLVEGVVSYLIRQPEQLDLKVVDLNQPDVLAQVVSVCPAVVILDDSYPEALRPFTLQELIQCLPELTIIRLDHKKVQIQVVCCEQHMVDEICDLVALIEVTAPK